MYEYTYIRVYTVCICMYVYVWSSTSCHSSCLANLFETLQIKQVVKVKNSFVLSFCYLRAAILQQVDVCGHTWGEVSHLSVAAMACVRPRPPRLRRSREKLKWWADGGMETLGADTLTDDIPPSSPASASAAGYMDTDRVNGCPVDVRTPDLKLPVMSNSPGSLERWSSSSKLSASLSVWG